MLRLENVFPVRTALIKSKPTERQTMISNLLILGIGEIGAAGHLYFREQKRLLRDN